jgi:hypothetical protein
VGLHSAGGSAAHPSSGLLSQLEELLTVTQDENKSRDVLRRVGGELVGNQQEQAPTASAFESEEEPLDKARQALATSIGDLRDADRDYPPERFLRLQRDLLPLYGAIDDRVRRERRKPVRGRRGAVPNALTNLRVCLDDAVDSANLCWQLDAAPRPVKQQWPPVDPEAASRSTLQEASDLATVIRAKREVINRLLALVEAIDGVLHE